MLEKTNVTTEKYKLNKKTTLGVKNTLYKDELGVEHCRVEVTLKHKLTQDTPLTFANADEVSDFVLNVDLMDDQLEIPGLGDGSAA